MSKQLCAMDGKTWEHRESAVQSLLGSNPVTPRTMRPTRRATKQQQLGSWQGKFMPPSDFRWSAGILASRP
jgi:hypothetical protein